MLLMRALLVVEREEERLQVETAEVVFPVVQGHGRVVVNLTVVVQD